MLFETWWAGKHSDRDLAEAAWNAAITAVWETMLTHNEALEDSISGLYSADAFDDDEVDEYDMTGAGDQPAT